MSNLQVPDFSKFDGAKAFAYRVESVNAFWITAEFPAISDWDDQKLRSKLQDRLHDDVTNLLRTAEFFSESQIEQSKAADHFAISYNDDIFDFKIFCYQNRIVVQKSGIQWLKFHHWFFAAVPSFKTVIDSLLSVMSKDLGRSQVITRSSFHLRFVLHDFQDGGRTMKNYEVMRKLITKIPRADGAITDIVAEYAEISRADYKVNCWDGENADERRLLSYSVEAPANREYAGLWFDFHYGSGTYSDPETGRREWVDPAGILDEYARVYDFFWKKAVNSFMNSLVGNLSFKTTPTYIP